MRVFEEKQYFNQWWFRSLTIVVSAIIVGSVWFSYTEIKENSTMLWVTVATSIFAIGLLVFISFFLKLETKIDEQGIQYRFWPFQIRYKKIHWSEIQECYVRTYNPISEYGGWGYRTGFGRTSGAMNVKGNIGIQIVLENNKKLLIGTQEKNKMEQVLNTYKHKIQSS